MGLGSITYLCVTIIQCFIEESNPGVHRGHRWVGVGVGLGNITHLDVTIIPTRDIYR